MLPALFRRSYLLYLLLPAEFILDGEVLAYKGGRPLHFQELQKRLRRKTVTDCLMAEIPVIYVPYDIMYLDGQPLIDRPLTERKKLLSQIRFKESIIDLGFRIVSTAQEIACAFKESRDAGHEGLVVKELESQYHPGKRGRHWTKLKHELDTIDAVIVIAEYGHGKRAGTLSDYTFAVRDEYDGGLLKTIGKAYSGLTDAEIGKMTDKLRSITVRDEGYRLVVRPEIILEVAFDSIQKSDRHNSGFALRFPRRKYIWTDKTVSDIDTLEKVQRIYEAAVVSKEPLACYVYLSLSRSIAGGACECKHERPSVLKKERYTVYKRCKAQSLIN